MKYLATFAVLFAVGSCNQGVHLGTFKTDCAAKQGTLAQTAKNEYSCTLPDGTVLKTIDK